MMQSALETIFKEYPRRSLNSVKENPSRRSVQDLTCNLYYEERREQFFMIFKLLLDEGGITKGKIYYLLMTEQMELVEKAEVAERKDGLFAD